MKNIKIIFNLLMLSALFLFPKSGYSQNGNSLNQHNKSKNATGTSNSASNPKKSKEKSSHNKQGNFANQSTAEDNLPVDSLNVVPVIIMNNKKGK